MVEKLYGDLDELFYMLIKPLDEYNESTTLQNYYFKLFESFFYGTIINNFFSNLTPGNLEEFELTIEMCEGIKSKNKNIIKDVTSAISIEEDPKVKKIDITYYNNFKTKIATDFPKFLDYLSELEKKVDISHGKKYLKNKKKEIRKKGQVSGDMSSRLMTKLIEGYVKKKNTFPSAKNLEKLLMNFTEKSLPGISEILFESLKDNSKNMLTEQRGTKKEFEAFLYNEWEEPLDLLESLIRVSYESVDKHRQKTDKKNYDIKFGVLIQIHARALQISNEILILLNSGYPDGANARWRSLHELAIISFFLKDSDNNVSQRYIEHEAIARYKEALVYQEYCEELDEIPLDDEFLDKLKKRKEDLCYKYDNFYGDWGWIPSTILKNKNFRSLENHVGFAKLRPYYKLSSANVHGSARGLYRMGLREDYQNKILCIGASNYGLADPLQNTAISLMHITNCLLSIRPNLESLIKMRVINYYIGEIGIKAVDVQNEIKEKSKENKL